MKKIFNIVLTAVATAMGIAVVVLSALGNIDAMQGISLLGIGVACIGVKGLLDK